MDVNGINIPTRTKESKVPDSWDADMYRTRAARWREQAEVMTPGPERDACLTLANGYANLAALIAKSETPAPGRSGSPNSP